MKPVYRGVAVAVLQCSLVLAVAGKYAFDRARLPRVWAKVAPASVNLPMTGRYLNLRTEVEAPPSAARFMRVRLDASGGHLSATPDATSSIYIGIQQNNAPWTLMQTLPFYLPGRAPTGLELWVEVSVPPHELPRPIRLGVKKDGVVRPLTGSRGPS